MGNHATPEAQLEKLREQNAALVEALTKLVAHVDRETCMHEETHRGGAIWEICDSCGKEWADDEGGKPEWADLPVLSLAREALAKVSP